MSETWEETRARYKKLGILKEEKPVEIPKLKQESKEDEIPNEPLWEVRKITLPVDRKYPQGQVILTGITMKEADWWLEFKLKPKLYENDATEQKTYVFFEKFLVNGTPKERNIYSNPARFCTEDFPDFKTPRRIN